MGGGRESEPGCAAQLRAVIREARTRPRSPFLRSSLSLSLSLFILFSFPTRWPFPSLPDILGISKQLLRTVLKMAWPESPRKWDERDR